MVRCVVRSRKTGVYLKPKNYDNMHETINTIGDLSKIYWRSRIPNRALSETDQRPFEDLLEHDMDAYLTRVLNALSETNIIRRRTKCLI